MSKRNHINRTLVTIQCQPLVNNSYVTQKKTVKTEPLNSEMKSNLPVTVKRELCDTQIKKEYNSSIIVIDDSPSKLQAPMGSLVKQELSLENIKTEPIQIKSEYSDNSYASVEQPIFKSENEHKKSIKMLPETEIKKESTEVNMIYRCCRRIFTDKYEHFEHMIGHTEKSMKRLRKNNKCIKCYYCHRFFIKEGDMIRHAKSMHTGFSCTYCHLNFTKKRLLLRHLTIAHGVTFANNQNYYPHGHLKWERQRWNETEDKKCVKKNKMEQVPPIKTEPTGNVEIEFKPINIKLETSKIEPM